MKKNLLFLVFFCLIFLFAIINVPAYGEKVEESIPRLYLYGDISDMASKEDIRNVKVEYDSTTVNFESFATLKLQGASSLQYPKKNYTIKFYSDENGENKNKIDFGWGNYYKYTLKANYIDRTHTRNLVSSRIVGDINKKYGYFGGTPNNGAIDGFAIEIYVNDEFHGLYTLNLHKDYMFDDSTDKDFILISTNGDYFFYPENIIEDSDWSNFEVEVGEQNTDTLNKLNRLLTFINTSTDEEFKRDVEKYFNLDSLLNYYCYVRFADLSDSLSNNLFFLTYDGEIWYTVFYDMDVSYGVTWQGYPEYTYNISSYMNTLNLWRKLQNNFPDFIAQRYEELRTSILTKNNVMNEFYNFYNTIPAETLKKDQELWSDTPYYDMTAVSHFLDVRIPMMDKYIKSMNKSNNKAESKNDNTNTSEKEDIDDNNNSVVNDNTTSKNGSVSSKADSNNEPNESEKNEIDKIEDTEPDVTPDVDSKKNDVDSKLNEDILKITQSKQEFVSKEEKQNKGLKYIVFVIILFIILFIVLIYIYFIRLKKRIKPHAEIDINSLTKGDI